MATPSDPVIDFPGDDRHPLDAVADMPVYQLVSAEFELPDEEVVAGRYDLIERIARGGMGSIYRGRDRLLNRTVAVKVLRSKFLDRPDLLRRFMDEAQISAKLQHPGIVPVYEVGTLNDGRPYIAMKLIEGMTLAKLLAERANPKENLGHFLKVFESLCQTISYAHSQGVIHRDLKPDNVMVGAFGEVLVMDWGLAKSLDEKLPKLAWGPLEVSDFASFDGLTPADGHATEPADCRPASVTDLNLNDLDSNHLTNPGQVFGTMRYMPPEQARGDRKRIDRRSDVFALGGILCEILTGAPPYSGTNEIMREHARAGNLATAYQKLDRCGADAALVMLVKHCLAVNPDDRPPDAAALADMLSEFLEGMQARNRAMEIERFTANTQLQQAEYTAAVALRDRRRSRMMAVLAAFAGVGLAIVGLWLTVERRAPSVVSPNPANIIHVADTLQATDELLRQTRAQRGDPERWFHASYPLERALQRQQDALETASDVTTEQHTQGERLHQDTTNEIRAARLAWALRRQPLTLFDARTGRYEPARAAKQCADQLTHHNVDLLGQTPATAAAVLNEHPAAELVTARVVEWLALSPDANDRKHLAATLQQVTATPRVSDTWLTALATQEVPALERAITDASTSWLPPAAIVAVARWLPAPHAAHLLEQGVRRYPASAPLNAELGQHLQANPAKRATALRYLAAAVAADPNMIPARIHLATALADAGQADEGLALLHETARLDPKSAAVPYHIGQMLEARGQLTDALTAYRAAVIADPSFAPAQVRVGQAAFEAKDDTAAEQAFRAALAFAPDDRTARTGLACVLLRKGEVTQALAQFDPTSAANVKLAPRTLQTFVAALRTQNRQREAFALLQANANQPRTPELQYEWGLYELAHDNPAALVNLQAASELLPKDAAVRGAYADALAAFGKFRLAAMTYRQAAELLPTMDPRRDTYTNAARTMTRFAGLEAHVTRIGSDDVQSLSATSLAELGEVCRRTQRFAAAAKFYALAAKTEQRHAEAAAYSAAYAGWGLGTDATNTTLADRVFLRQQALAWFKQVPKQLTPTNRLGAFLLCPGVLQSIPAQERREWQSLLPNNFAANRSQR